MIKKSILFKSIEPSIPESLEYFSKSIMKLGFIKYVRQAYQDNDEIKFHQYISQVELTPKETDGVIFTTDSHPGGSSLFLKDTALLKCLGESVERISTQTYLDKDQIFSKYDDLKIEALNPDSFNFFSKKQLESEQYIKYRVTKKTPLAWTQAYSLPDLKETLIPTQLVYYSYKHRKNEGCFAPLISTGAAGGGTLTASILRGLYEIIERDSYMIFYLNRLSGRKIDLRSINNEKISKALRICSRYKLTWHAIDITSDLGIPVIVSILTDETGIGSSISMGLKSDFNILDAIIGSFEESLHIRNFSRHSYENADRKKLKNTEIINVKTRAIYWHEVKMLKHLDFWVKQEEIVNDTQIDARKISQEKSLKKAIQTLRKHKIEIYFKDISRKDVKNVPYYVAKVIIPKLCPLYLNERYPFLGSKRLYEVPSILGYSSTLPLNNIPHPFL